MCITRNQMSDLKSHVVRYAVILCYGCIPANSIAYAPTPQNTTTNRNIIKKSNTEIGIEEFNLFMTLL